MLHRKMRYKLSSQLAAIRAPHLSKNLLVCLNSGVLETDSSDLGSLLLLLLVLVSLDLDGCVAGNLVAIQTSLKNVLDQVISAENLASLEILAHPVREAIDVTGSLEDLGRGHDRAVNLEHILLEHKVLAPDVEHVGLEGAAWGAVVVKTSNTCVIESTR